MSMSKYVFKEASGGKSHVGNKSAADRAKEFPSVLHSDGGKLFCSICNVLLDHKRLSTIKDHLNSQKHKARSVQHTSRLAGTSKQTTIGTSFKKESLSAERKIVSQDLVKACVSANIPLTKLDNSEFRSFLNKHVVNGGSIPSHSQLRKEHLPALHAEYQGKLMTELEGKQIAIVTDETTDVEMRYVLNIIFIPLNVHEGKLQPFLVDTVMLEKTNSCTVAQSVIKAVSNYNIDYNNVLGFVTDNAAYMLKAYKDTLNGVFPHCIHITCIAHILSLVGDVWRKTFKDVDAFVSAMKMLFCNAPARKARFMNYLRDRGLEVKAPVIPVIVRWNSWFQAVMYHDKITLEVYRSFLEEELQHTSVPSNALAHVIDVMQNDVNQKKLSACLKFIAEMCQKIVQLLTEFESQSPKATEVYDTLVDLKAYLELQSKADHSHYLNEVPAESSVSVKQLFKIVFISSLEKLAKYQSAQGQPGWNFLKYVRIFSPNKALLLSHNFNNYVGVLSLLASCGEVEFATYIGILRDSDCLDVDPFQFWDSIKGRCPVLAGIARAYLCIPTNSVDCERSFSFYKDILSDNRRNLLPENIKMLNMLHFNTSLYKE
ncbi:uncharacterized protein LOC134535762 isoform X1 [Bacillus rossius redtenbacheri]|uniref:uncharacterized protein LOC134535762 isoform X1 n=1 Tax=Bacillus rossius redtenbacheri TaxID=93214 RepID=UPI002FDC8E22